MRRVTFLLCLPLIGAVGFVLSFYPPNSVQAQPSQETVEPANGEPCVERRAKRDWIASNAASRD